MITSKNAEEFKKFLFPYCSHKLSNYFRIRDIAILFFLSLSLFLSCALAALSHYYTTIRAAGEKQETEILL